MKKRNLTILICTLVITVLFTSTALGAGKYKITANIIDLPQVSFITGMVTDASGKGIYPADVIFSCGASQIKFFTLPNGAYVGNPPPCIDFTITASAPGLGESSKSGLSLDQGQILPLDLSISSYEPSVEDLVRMLQILSRLETDVVPPDQSGDEKLGLEDAVFVMQSLAGLRGGTAGQSLRGVVRVAMAAGKSVKIGRDTDGDGEDDWFQETITDEYGFLEVADLPNGTYTLTAVSSDNSKAVRVENIKIAGRSVHLKTLRMKPVGSISGQVQLEGETDHAGIHVYVPGTSFDASTDSSGNFTIFNVPEGTYDLRASKQNFGTITMKDVPVEPEQETSLDVLILPSVVGSVAGTVWLQGETDYTGVLVTLRKDAGTTYLTTTDAQGNYAFQDIPVGDYELEVAMPGFIPKSSSISIATGSNGQAPILLNINTSKGALAGTVTKDNFGDYSGILVALAGTQYQAVTDSSGIYTINDIPQGSYTVFMKAEGYGALRIEDVQITAGKTTTQDGSLTASEGEAFGSIVGTATYLGQESHGGISVKVEGTDIPLVGTDTNGGFIISNVPAGTCKLLFTQANYETVVRSGVVVTPWETTFVKPVEMIPPVGNISGKVELEGESSHDNVTVSVDGTSISAQSLPDGAFLLEGVNEGTANITAYKAGFQTARISGIKVLPGQTAILDEIIHLARPPEAPTGMIASQASGSSVGVSWTASTSTDVAGYNVYYSTRSDQIDQKANSDLVADTSYEVTGLSKGVTYYFAVKAVDQDGL
ncbi:MAG: carboxypeptidase regulatory-like domain-containing protein, partial [Deltaproteobacteria bacterium]|nr:carboxypeptidase regulatory-like domain-containing protein [Deltaproteobacteria bacterium]